MTRRCLLSLAASAVVCPAEARTKTEIDLEGRKISVEYDVVLLNGRQFGRTLAPFGKIWRFGSEAPTITVTAYTLTVMFELLPGAYRLFAIPQREQWTLIPSTATSGKTYETSQDVGRFDVPVKRLSKPVDQLTMALTREASNVARLTISIDHASISTELKML